jgi:membrane-associated PAP2 superfamily phosphatase
MSVRPQAHRAVARADVAQRSTLHTAILCGALVLAMVVVAVVTSQKATSAPDSLLAFSQPHPASVMMDTGSAPQARS